MDRKRVRRGESFGRLGVDRTISNSLKSPSRQKLRFVAGQGNNEDIKGGVITEEQVPVTQEVPQVQQQMVRFTEETPEFHLCSNFDKDMNDKDYEERKKELWYSREDFESFLKERIDTISLLKVVKGDAIALRLHCPDLCLRGLEPFQCNTLNQEMQCQRQWHLRVVLTEQTMQKTLASKDPERIRQLACERSEWARVRAHQLASLDELEAKGLYNAVHVRRRSMAFAELGMAKLMLGQQPTLQQPLQSQVPKRRASLTLTSTPTSGTASSLNPLGLSSTRRVPVDMAILKEWNAKFLADMRRKTQLNSSSSSSSTITSGTTNNVTPNLAGSSTISINNTTTTSTLSDIKSLSDKTAESRRALQSGSSMLWPTGLLPGNLTNTAPSSNTHDNDNTRNKDDIVSAPRFRFPVRRDSLVGLRRESFIAGLTHPSSPSCTDPTKEDPTKEGIASPSCSADDNPAADNPAETINNADHPATSGLSTLAEACFRFPVRRDSLSNVDWN